MAEERSRLYFCSAEEDSIYAIKRLEKPMENSALSEWEARQLFFMKRRAAEGMIYLTPAVIYAVANQKNCGEWLQRAGEDRQKIWYQSGVAWMRRYPAFLEKFGWKERKNAILAAGILARAESEDDDRAWEPVRGVLRGGWRFLWNRMKGSAQLDDGMWQEMMEPWADSPYMSSGMAGVILLMASLLQKPVRDRDQLWRSLQKLRNFSQDCLKAPKLKENCAEDLSFLEDGKMEWLLTRFRNPQRPAYIKEKARLGSEWLEQLYRIMELAGLPASACETMTISCREVQQLLGAMEDKLTERQYMTFLMLYTVSRELAQAGRAAAALDIPGSRSLVM